MNPLNKYMDLPPAEIPFSDLHLSELEPLALFAGNQDSQQLAIRELVARIRAIETMQRETGRQGGKAPKGIISKLNGMKGGRPPLKKKPIET